MAEATFLQNILNYHFTNQDLLKEALQTAGTCNQQHAVTPHVEGNKRLALLGDAVIRLLILDGWYPKQSPIREIHPTARKRLCLITPQGTGDNAVRSSASNRALAELAHKYGLEDFVTKNPAQKDWVADYTLATTVEALLGAVWVDCNKKFEVIEQVIQDISLVKE